MDPGVKYIEIPAHLSKPAGTPGSRLLEIERAKASFSSDDLTLYLHGKEHLERVKRILPVLENEPAFDKSRIHFMSRTDKFKAGLAKEKRLAQLLTELDWSAKDHTLAEDMLDWPAAFGLHKVPVASARSAASSIAEEQAYKQLETDRTFFAGSCRSMFLKTLAEQSNEEQLKLFYEPAKNFEIIGCYAQTELGHGSNVQGLETIAVYQPESKTFKLQSPSLTAMKWWIGGLGRTADHAVVMAQLHTPDGRDGKLVKRGPYPFVVPLRDVKTRELLPGRTIMDIGPKAGYAMTDNGAMLLDNVEIPHINFLARWAKVDIETGKFEKPVNARLSYGTMTYIRANIVQQARMVLARSATVAIRYCAVRRQFADRDAPVLDGNKPAETQVLNYQLVQHRIFPPLVQAFACHYTGKEMFRLYEDNQTAMADGDFSRLADVHASSSGLKSLCTIMASGAIEECRRACGGHGFSLSGGLASFYADYLPQVTWEGDSYMLTQQVGRYLFKTFRVLLADRDAPMSSENRTRDYILRYISDPEAKASAKYAGDLADPEFFIQAFGHRAAYLTATALRKRDIERRTWNSLLIDIFRMSVAHSQFVLVYNFANAIKTDKDLQSQPALLRIMTTCFELFATYTMDSEAAEFLSSGYISPKQHELLRNRVHALLAELRPQAVPLVDSWGIPDYQLNSALGRYDGDVYPAIVRFAQAEPLNKTRFNVNIHEKELEVGPEMGQSKGSKL
ncbi:BZ3500_MvSof-1268-A1-R1_Chr11-1g03206 [Microbotryum saponariae]|uniref:Acyl-coenzyme A oxidase n=1 Tax=Microbotryum saponariae TaxID=289078 RepID=A0A2X0L7Z8_9BASI|nr:BZ3501_MvSof-1269-A2-R1_Chr11g02781 [Microbotryum saponariae]SDA03766.1 BZ3500_MvSof-1268-A1-R1_Chr11-1g03206 [Microbotryum saponariae]